MYKKPCPTFTLSPSNPYLREDAMADNTVIDYFTAELRVSPTDNQITFTDIMKDNPAPKGRSGRRESVEESEPLNFNSSNSKGSVEVHVYEKERLASMLSQFDDELTAACSVKSPASRKGKDKVPPSSPSKAKFTPTSSGKGKYTKIINHPTWTGAKPDTSDSPSPKGINQKPGSLPSTVGSRGRGRGMILRRQLSNTTPENQNSES